MADFQKNIENEIDVINWQNYTCGMIEGAVRTLFSIPKLSKEIKIELLSSAIGLSVATAKEYIEEYETKSEMKSWG